MTCTQLTCTQCLACASPAELAGGECAMCRTPWSVAELDHIIARLGPLVGSLASRGAIRPDVARAVQRATGRMLTRAVEPLRRMLPEVE